MATHVPPTDADPSGLIYIYLDFNVVLDIANGLSVELGPDQVFVYSDAHFVETARGHDLRPLEVFKKLNARMLDIELDGTFQPTGKAQIGPGTDPYDLYRSWQLRMEECPQEESFSVLLSRLYGAHNQEQLSTVPTDVERQLKTLLEEHGLLDEVQIERISKTRAELETFVAGDLKNVPPLEVQREAFGLHGGRASSLAAGDNPLEALWRIVGPTAPGLTADQVFGFEPIPGDPQQEIPLFYGIAACYSALNSFGVRPDKALADPSSLAGTLSDASHVAHAAYCHALLSADERLCAKARAIYRYKGIGTSVLLLKRLR